MINIFKDFFLLCIWLHAGRQNTKASVCMSGGCREISEKKKLLWYSLTLPWPWNEYQEKRRHTVYIIKSVLISNRLDLPFGSKRKESCLNGKRTNQRKRKQKLPSIFAALPWPSHSPKILISGETPTWSQQMISAGERSRAPELPANLPWGKKISSWARVCIQLGLVYIIKSHSVWKGTAIYPQPLLLLRQCMRSVTVVSTNCPLRPRNTLCLLHTLSWWANDGLWVNGELLVPTHRAGARYGALLTQEELKTGQQFPQLALFGSLWI